MQLDLFDYANHDNKIQNVSVGDCSVHPDNPRLGLNEDTIERLAAIIQVKGFTPEHAILVRQVEDKYQIISGHQRHAAAIKAGLETIYAWVIVADDIETHSLLLLENEQSELTALEKGKHAYDHLAQYDKAKGGAGKTGGMRKYAREHNYGNVEVIRQWLEAYEVYKTVKNLDSLSHSILFEISKAPEEAWEALCECAEKEEWTVKDTSGAVKKIQEIVFHSECDYDIQAIYRDSVDGKGKGARKYALLFDEIRRWLDVLPEKIILYSLIETDQTKTEDLQIYRLYEATPFDYFPNAEFLKAIKTNKPVALEIIQEIASNINDLIERDKARGNEWRPELTEDELDKLRVIAITQERQTYLEQRIRHGEMEYEITKIPSDSIKLILTDPPYGLGQTSDIQFKDREDMASPKGEWDQTVAYAIWLKEFSRVLKNDGSIYIFVPDSEISNLWTCLIENGFIVRNLITWHKTNPAPSVRQRCFCHSCEYILFATKGDKYTFNWTDQNDMHNHIEIPICQGKEKKDHPTQKPIALLKKYIAISTELSTDIILDPFAGVGSTGVAAYGVGIDFIMIEKERRYIDETYLRFPAEIKSI